MGTTRLKYARVILAHPSFVATPEHEKALVAVMASEGSAAHWNPLDTTLDMPGATPYNSFGPNGSEHVWNYPDARSGIMATVRTLLQPNMAPFTDTLRVAGTSALEVCRAYAKVPWSGVGNVVPFQLVTQWSIHWLEWVEARRIIVPGPGPWPYNRRGLLVV